MNRSYVFRIYPTAEQAATLRQFSGASRFIYNIALEQRRDWWRQFKARTGRNICWASQSLEVTELRRQVSWLAAVPRSLCEQSLRDLDKAFTAFWKGGGFPSFRSSDRHRSFRLQGAQCRIRVVNKKWAYLKLPNLGAVKLRLTRALAAAPINVTVRQDADKWFAVFNFQAEQAPPAPGSAIGIDRGISNTLSLSSGENHTLPIAISATTIARRNAQRILSRRKKGSRRRLKQRIAVAELHRRAAATRNHWLHERSTDIARRFGHVAIEDLKVANMTRAGKGKRGLNRSILEQGWSIFANMLAYKLEDRGGTLHLVNPAYTSQTCSECGSVNAESRKSQAVFQCVDCGHAAHADTNAAINILRRSPAGVEGAGYGPVEARTGAMLTHRENLAA